MPPLLSKILLGGGLFWAVEDNDGDRDRGFKAGSAVSMPTGWRDDESAAGRTTVLARWRDDESAARRKARGTPPACNH